MFKTIKPFLIVASVTILIGISTFIYNKYTPRGDPPLKQDIRAQARRSSVQTVFNINVLHGYFTSPLPEPEIITKDIITEMLEDQAIEIEAKIDEAITKYREELKEDRYEKSMTDIEKWGYEPPSKTFIPLGAFAPEWAKFPDRILVTCKIDKEEISPWEKEYEDDVLTISETANVSPKKAKEILQNIISKGYTISKESIKEAEGIELLYFTTWDSHYPRHLDWTVNIEGNEDNLIIGYDPRGIFETKPIPHDKKVHVKAGYFDLKSKFKETPTEIQNLQDKLDKIQEELKDANETIYELNKKDEKPTLKRDISKATLWDVKVGSVALDQLYFVSAASGIFLGNMDIRREMQTWSPWRGWGSYVGNTESKKAAVILTNAHVAGMAMSFKVYVSEDKEHIWILFPGAPSIRYTPQSDYFGTPAWVLGMDQFPVISTDCDAGILLSTPVPGYENNKVVLGNSDNVQPGDEVITVGNPMGLQKFTTQGIISNTNYSILDSLDGGIFLQYVLGNKPGYAWMLHSNFWIDTTIGIGGVSGSGVWATEGSEAGKVIALRNMGMVTGFSRVSSVSEVNMASLDTDQLPDTLGGITKSDYKYLFHDPKPTKGYSETYESFLEKYPSFKGYEEQAHHSMQVAGINGCIPINYIKVFLQERGMDPEHFNWDNVKKGYWEK